MGYPMTWKRVINRNGLHDGNYRDVPRNWRSGTNCNPLDDGAPSVSAARRESLMRLEERAASLAGDLRRLEIDALDEKEICTYISHRTKIDSGTVAIILKEFMNF